LKCAVFIIEEVARVLCEVVIQHSLLVF